MYSGGDTIVVFHDHGGHWLDPLLKKGFKHVFCAIRSGDYWIVVDGRTGGPVVQVVAGADYDLKSFYENEGYTVLVVERGTGLRLPLVLSNCVGIVKATLGLGHFGVLTPYQLYRRLKR
mgnify:CR=1 FL=1